MLKPPENYYVFSSNTSSFIRFCIKIAFGVTLCGNYEKYLGLPAMVGWSKFNTFRVQEEDLGQD